MNKQSLKYEGEQVIGWGMNPVANKVSLILITGEHKSMIVDKNVMDDLNSVVDVVKLFEENNA